MQRIPYVDDIVMTDIAEQPLMRRGESGKPEPATMSQYEFMLNRLTDKQFAGKREGMEAIEFVLETRSELKRQKATAKTAGGWDLEDERARALRDRILHPTDGYNPEIQHNLWAFVDAGRKMAPAPKTEVNGVVASSQPPPPQEQAVTS